MKLLELVTGSVLLGLLCAMCASLLHSQAALLKEVSGRLAETTSVRTARDILLAELRDLRPEDIRAVARDSIALRVFRGWGIACSPRGIRYSGLRAVDAGKDSMLIAETPSGFTGGGPANDCGGLNNVIRVNPNRPLTPGSPVLFFETGTYYLANGALRYRRGREGRQPVTDELLDDRFSRLVPESAALRIDLKSKRGSLHLSRVRLP